MNSGSQNLAGRLADSETPEAEVLTLIATGRARTRAEIIAITGLSRSTVGKRLQDLLDEGVISEGGTDASSGGRPARLLTFNKANGLVVAVDIGEDHTRVALTDLAPDILAESIGETDLSAGPEAVLSWVDEEISRLTHDLGRPSSDILGICLGLPAPVDWKNARVVGPSVMPGWDGFDIRGAIRRAHDAPVIIDNDVNLLGLAELRRYEPGAEYLLFIKAGTGIGSAIITAGSLYRGASGAAGDIGHIHLQSSHEPLCRCGKLGCVEATAGGWAIARDLAAIGIPAESARDVVRLAEHGKPEAIRLLRDAGRALGEAVAAAISMLNPDVLVLGGVLSQAGDHLAIGVREVIYGRSLPLSTNDLRITTSQLDEHAGVLGAAQLVIDGLLRSSAPSRP